MARTLGAEQTAALDVELRAAREGFKALAKRYGARRQDIEAHKRRCLNGSTQTTQTNGSTPDPARTRTRPHEAHDFDARVSYVLGELTAGTFDGPRDVPILASAWGLSQDHTRRIVKSAGAAYRAAADLDVARPASLGRWLALYQDAFTAGDRRGAAAALAGHDRVAGIGFERQAPGRVEDDPAFQEAAQRFVDAAFAALDVAAVAPLLPDLDRSDVERVLQAAGDILAARIAPLLPEPKATPCAEMN